MAQDLESIQSRAEEGDAAAQYMLGLSHYRVDGGALPLEEAVKRFRSDAEKSLFPRDYFSRNESAPPKFVPWNSEALKWFRLAAEQGHVEAQFHLGCCLCYCCHDTKAAAEWFRRAAEQGHAEAQYRIGLLYEKMHSPRDLPTCGGRLTIISRWHAQLQKISAQTQSQS